ncbi:MAG: NUDIX hydrolase [Jatrophihabitans sp.]
MSEPDDYQVVESEVVFAGKIVTVRRDDVRMSDGSMARREIVEHPGAVAVVALDENGNVVLVNQYRHAVRARLDELPAGLLDVAGESALEAAKRELAEEAGLSGQQWNVLLDLQSSPGISDEAVRVFLARGLAPEHAPGFTAEHEEAAMTVTREPLNEAVRRALVGDLTNAIAVAGLLAAAHGRDTDWRDLRAADAAWPARSRR